LPSQPEIMRSFIALIVLSIVLFSCTNNDTSSTKGYTTEDSIKHAKMLEAANDSANYTSIQWLDSLHQELGKVAEGAQVEVTWRFKNTGNKPLIISQANASCGCTVPEKPNEPIPPGGEEHIKAMFNSTNRSGTQTKEVFVVANTNGGTSHKLSFSVDVQKK
jgi:hypothetical protein